MKKKVLNFTLVFVVMILIISILTGCGRKTEEKIVYANIVIESVDQNEKQTITTAKPNRELLSTYEELINSSAVKTVIEKQYRTIGDVQFEEVENTQIIRVIYVCDNHTDDECKMLLNDWITEFSRRMKEIYNDKDIKIVDGPQITTRIVEK
ncbi:MAG: hypothetical protein IJH12_06105 [Clostridia bacterium]|nr:hypothetical protein [Clostridia bacterium]